ncbi:hypothetical protein [Mixta mediterraneensis]|uniref:hypothetical protein n=1 Tax=Mixta mediterraneensis TaxID=2758443 RepID=UPI0018749FDF|nr:hypothetical protein [Mixta mediterraneensis]MBE5250877.1 hypothetical protein [Mixta mediterraneensis]
MTYQPLIAEVHNQQHTLTAIVEQNARTAYFYIVNTDRILTHPAKVKLTHPL